MAKLVLLGGGHAHMTVLAKLRRIIEDGHQAVVVQPSDFHYYSGMGPGMLGGTYDPENIRFNTRLVVEKQGGRFLNNAAVHIDPVRQQVTLKDGTTIGYDLLSCNTGSYVPLSGISDRSRTLIPAKPIEGLAAARDRIVNRLKSESISIAVVGGGPSAIEIAGNLRQLGNRFSRHEMKISLLCGRRVMADASSWLQKKAETMLQARNIELHGGTYVERIENEVVTLTDGSSHRFDFIFGALGVIPSPLFADSALSVGPDKGLAVNRWLQSVDSPSIFGGGDCIHFLPQPLDKVGVYAVRQNPVLLNNLMAALAGKALEPFEPGGGYLLIYNLGDGQGIMVKGALRFSGALAFMIKDSIDRRFIRRFKALEA